MPSYAFEGFIPVVDPTSFVHPTAVLIGDVIIGPGCYIGPCAALRGDMGRITIEEGSNVQDNCVLHTFPGADMRLAPLSHVGHGAILHGCNLARNVLIGMNSVVMDGVEVGEDSFVGAMSFVKANFVVPPRSLVLGSPARVMRELTKQELAWKAEGTAEYHALARRCLSDLRPCEPLAAPEPGRARRDAGVLPLADRKKNQAVDA
jgi:phenylacetic acid degradation protein